MRCEKLEFADDGLVGCGELELTEEGGLNTSFTIQSLFWCSFLLNVIESLCENVWNEKFLIVFGCLIVKVGIY